MAKYRKKPVEVEAVQFCEDEYHHNRSKYNQFHVNDMANYSEVWFNKSADDGRYYIKTPEGNMAILEGDYITKGTKGELYAYALDTFKSIYEKVE